jgi:hypothetical protein
MERTIRPLRVLVWTAGALLAAPSARAMNGSTDDHYRFLVDSVTTKIEFALDTSLGSCTIPAGTSGGLSGHIFMQLHSGVGPLGSGSCDGGDCTCHPDLVGVIPNPVPGGPDLLELDFLNLRISPTTPLFLVSHGAFDTTGSFACLDGTMVVRMLGHAPVNVPLAGLVSDSASSHGVILIDQAGIHVGRQFSNRLNVDVPVVGLVVHLGVAGVIRADMSYPQGERFCTPSVNSSGLAGRLDITGTTSVTMNDCGIQVSQCPHDTFGLCFFGQGRGQVTFGNGTRCVTGPTHRLPPMHFSANGSASLALDLSSPGLAPYLQPGTTWGFQCGFRDQAAGGAKFNATDAVSIRFVP